MYTNSKFPLYLPGLNIPSNEAMEIVSADIQDEFTFLGHYKTQNKSLVLQNQMKIKTTDFNGFSEIISHFFKENHLKNINKIAVGIPGPVFGNSGIAIRLGWDINAEEIKASTGVSEVLLINDLEATAFSLAEVTDKNLTAIHKSDLPVSGNVAILAPGNGLGEAGLFYDGESLRPFATEGGHSEFSPRTNVEVEFYQFLNKIYGIVTWENVLSKNGMFNIFRFLRDEKGHPLSPKLVERLRENQDFCTSIYQSATEDNEQIATITINTYLEFLARESNSLVLKLKATGGLILGGEIPYLLKEYIDPDRFYNKFMISDKMEKLLKNTPIYLYTAEQTIMKGAAYFAAYSK